MQAILNHLWQSTVFAGIAWLLTLTLKKNRAQTRYWLWFAASMKFLVPFTALVSLGSLAPRPAHIAPMPLADAVGQSIPKTEGSDDVIS